MIQRNFPIGRSIELAVISNVYKTHVECTYYGKDEKTFDCPIPHPYISKSGGVLIGPKKDTVVLVSQGYSERKFIVGFVAASILFSFVLVPLFASLFQGDGLKLVEMGVIKAVTNPLRGWFFCMAFVSIGLESNFKELAKQMEGGKPMVLYVVGQSFNLILTLAIAWLAFIWLFPNAI